MTRLVGRFQRDLDVASVNALLDAPRSGEQDAVPALRDLPAAMAGLTPFVQCAPGPSSAYLDNGILPDAPHGGRCSLWPDFTPALRLGTGETPPEHVSGGARTCSAATRCANLGPSADAEVRLDGPVDPPVRTVSVVRCHSYLREQVQAAVSQAVDHLGGFGAFVSAGDRVLVKPNLLVASAPGKAVTTHPEVVRAVVRGCQRVGAEVWVGDSPGVGDPARVAQRCGILDVCQETGARFVPLSEPVVTSFPDGRVAKSFPLGRPVLEADKVISVAKFKTHGLMLYTGAVKNLYGTIAGLEKTRLHMTYQSPEEFARLLVDLYHAVHPVLSLVDGIVAMEGSGPRTGDPRPLGLILAGADGFDVDLAAAAIMGVAPEALPLMAALAEADPAAVRVEDLTIVGVPLAEARALDFRVPSHLQATNLPAWLENLARRYTTARPVVLPDRCLACGVCTHSCPAGAIRVVDRLARIDSAKCIRCYCCQEMCPEGAIELRSSLLGRLVPWR